MSVNCFFLEAEEGSGGLQERRDSRTSQQVGSRVKWEPKSTREDQHRIKSCLDLPMRFPLMDAVGDEHANRTNEEAVVDPGVL